MTHNTQGHSPPAIHAELLHFSHPIISEPIPVTGPLAFGTTKESRQPVQIPGPMSYYCTHLTDPEASPPLIVTTESRCWPNCLPVSDIGASGVAAAEMVNALHVYN